ncbi:unnamed protein product [Caenorhabditis angaria]|uniref:Treslin STD domain-containing protein n=1 Tax=Caenorhabditis angaria TaxID=860376 RepID=A0A9P1I8S2_9PELO|nr:unnamed protein product [Caenorhabditis angaria]
MDGKTFEDFTFEVISRISPKRVQRDSIPFDSVREIILSELKFGTFKQQLTGTENGSSKKRVSEDMDDITSTSSSSHLAYTDTEESTSRESSSRFVSTMSNTDFDCDSGLGSKRTFSTKVLGGSTSSIIHHALSAPSLSSLENNFERKKPQNYRERRLAEMRAARIKNYRGESDIFEFECDETQLEEQFGEIYWKLINDVNVSISGAYFRMLESLDNYFRSRTWDSHCVKSCCEFLSASIVKPCQNLNEAHDEKDVSDEMRVRELMLQVLLGLHIFTFENDKKDLLDDTINKLRMIYIAADPQKMRTFLEEPITDIFVAQIPESIAVIYEELCIALPADLSHFETRFRAEIEEIVPTTNKRRNANANRLEQMLAENSGNYEEIKERNNGKLKRRSASEKDLRSPSRRQQNERKRFYVEDTPDDKYLKQEIDSDQEDIVQQTPMAKLRNAANKSGRRCSKRLSDLVKLSEERSEIPKKAKENLDKMLEKAKQATPIRSSKRTTRGILFSNHSPSPLSVTRSSRTSLQTRLQSCSSKPSTSERKCRDSPRKLSDSSIIENRTPVRKETFRLKIKREIVDEEYEKPAKKEESSLNGEYWSDRKIRSQLGLTRDDLNRYTERMLAAGTKKIENGKVKMESGDETNEQRQFQINRAGRVKDGSVFGVRRGRRATSRRSFMCHVLLNESNPGMNFDWSKVSFETLDDKPHTRGNQSFLAKPEKVLESLKRKYIETKSNPSPSTSSFSSSAKRTKVGDDSPCKKPSISNPRKCARNSPSSSTSRSVRSSPIKREYKPVYEEIEYDEFGFEREADY